MKKITFILFALISGTAFAQGSSATKTADVSAEIVEPLTLENTRVLSFGRILSIGEGGDVTISADDAGTRKAGSLAAPGGAVSSASFDITGSQYAYIVDVSAEPLKFGGDAATTEDNTEAMILTPNPSFEKNTGDATLYVGGTLAVGSNQASGIYNSKVSVTISYE